MFVEMVEPLEGIEEGTVEIYCPNCGHALHQWKGTQAMEFPVPDQEGGYGYTCATCLHCESEYDLIWAETDSIMSMELLNVLRFN